MFNRLKKINKKKLSSFEKPPEIGTDPPLERRSGRVVIDHYQEPIRSTEVKGRGRRRVIARSIHINCVIFFTFNIMFLLKAYLLLTLAFVGALPFIYEKLPRELLLQAQRIGEEGGNF